MKTVFKCDYCYNDYSTAMDCEQHESRCIHNPKTRGCETCANASTVVADTGKVWYACSKNLLPTSNRWIDNYKNNCDGYDSLTKIQE
jgi:hypothetical protein